MYLNTTRKNHSEQDYEPIPGPEAYGSAAHVYYNCVGGSISYDDSVMPEYSKPEPVNKSVAVNDDEEVFSDPGSSLAEFMFVLKRKRFVGLNTMISGTQLVAYNNSLQLVANKFSNINNPSWLANYNVYDVIVYMRILCKNTFGVKKCGQVK